MVEYSALPSQAGSSSYASGPRPHYLARARVSGGGSQSRGSIGEVPSSSPVRLRARGPRKSAFDTFDETSFCNDLISKISSELAARPKRQYVSRSQSIDPWRGNAEIAGRSDAACSVQLDTSMGHEESGVQTEDPVLESRSFKTVDEDAAIASIDAERTAKTKAAAEAFLQRLQERGPVVDQKNELEAEESELEKQVFAIFGDQINRGIQLPHEISSNSQDEEQEDDEEEPSPTGVLDSLLQQRHDQRQSKPLIEEVVHDEEEEEEDASEGDGEYDELLTSTSDHPSGEDAQEEEDDFDELEGDEGENEEVVSFYHQPKAFTSRGASEEQAISLIDSDDEDDPTSASEDGDATRESEQWQRQGLGLEEDQEHYIDEEDDENTAREQRLFGYEAPAELPPTDFSFYEDTQKVDDTVAHSAVSDNYDVHIMPLVAPEEGQSNEISQFDNTLPIANMYDVDVMDQQSSIIATGKSPSRAAEEESAPFKIAPSSEAESTLQTSHEVEEADAEETVRDAEPSTTPQDAEIMPLREEAIEEEAVDEEMIAEDIVKEHAIKEAVDKRFAEGIIDEEDVNEEKVEEAETFEANVENGIAEQDVQGDELSIKATTASGQDQEESDDGSNKAHVLDEVIAAEDEQQDAVVEDTEMADTQSSPRRSRRHARRSDPNSDLADYVPPEEEKKIHARRRSRTRTPSVSQEAKAHLIVSPGYVNPDTSILEVDEEAAEEATAVDEEGKEEAPNKAVQERSEVLAKKKIEGSAEVRVEDETNGKRISRRSRKVDLTTSNPKSSPRRRRKGEKEAQSDQPSPKRLRRSSRRTVNLNSS